MISVIIPANNEQGCIGNIVRACKPYCDEIIVIDDGSTDSTLTESIEAGATTYRNTSRMGIVTSIANGLRRAQGDVIVTMDGDGQHDAAEIQTLVRPILDGRADVVLGRRLQGIPLSERIIAQIVGLYVQCVDVGTGFRAVSRDLAKRMHLWGKCLCGSFVLEAYRNGARIIEVPISIHDRRTGRSHWPSPYSRGMTHGKQLSIIVSHTIRFSQR